MGTDEAVQQLSRRSLLKTGLVGVALVVGGGAGFALQPSRDGPAARGKLQVLSRAEYGVLTAIAARLCPALGPGAPGATALDVAGKADALLAGAEGDAQDGVKLALRTFESPLSGAIFLSHFRPYTQLSSQEQDRVLRGWRDSRVGFRRTVYRGLSSLVGALYYGDERTWKRIGYPGPPSPAGLRAAYVENLVDLHALAAKPSEGT